MHRNLQRISTLGMPRTQWLELRRRAIGGSDAAAIVGLNPYASPYSVWAGKTRRLPDMPDNEAMRQGRDLEEYVAQRWREATGKKVRRINAILYNPQYEFAHANIDRWVKGENAGLECKTTSIMNLKRFKGGNFPANYYVQCMHYMAVTGAERWYLAVLVLNQGFYEFVIERDETEIAALMEQEAAFWTLVQSDKPPAVDGMTPTSEALRAICTRNNGEAVELFGREALFRQFEELSAQKKQAEVGMERIKQQLMLDLGESDTGCCLGWKAVWRPQVRSTFDAAAFQEEHPKIDLQKYYKTTETRVMRITKSK